MASQERAVVTALWIGEVKPDLFSRVIQFCLRARYSHNAFIFEGKAYHGTIDDDPAKSGFRSCSIEELMKGSVVRFCRPVRTRFTPGELRGYLMARDGTPYSMRQNLAAMRPVLFDWPLIRLFFRNGKSAINCSEVLAEVCEGGTVLENDTPLVFGESDRVKPTDTFRVIQPDKCAHNHLLTTN